MSIINPLEMLYLQKTLLGVLGVLILSVSSYAAENAAYEIVRDPVYDADGVATHYLTSAFLRGESRVQVIRSETSTDRILYLLPVTPWPGFEEKWDRLGSGMAEVVKHDFHNRFGYTIVVPDFPGHMPWFVDHVGDAERQHETYMMRVVIPFVDHLLNVENPVRDLAGFSKGGFGSLSLLLRHPDVFHAAAAWDPGGVTKPFAPENVNSLSDAAGSKNRFDHYQLHASIKANVAQFRGPTRIAISGHSSDSFLEQLHALRTLLDHEQVPYLYSESVQVPHRWYSGWMEQALQSLEQLQEN